ncbi:hypothetical protein bcgnr5378_64080 [Bacillus cereus]|nr:hypothetical protein BCM0060_p319 [Bacillus cereus]BCC50625.1 hypothetical protein BCJMU02_p322 [Bacillus cereus]
MDFSGMYYTNLLTDGQQEAYNIDITLDLLKLMSFLKILENIVYKFISNLYKIKKTEA